MKKLLFTLLLIPTLAFAQFGGVRVITDSLQDLTDKYVTRWRIIGTNSDYSGALDDRNINKVQDVSLGFKFVPHVTGQDSIDAKVVLEISYDLTNWIPYDSTGTISDSAWKFKNFTAPVANGLRFRVTGVTGNDVDSGSYMRAIYIIRHKN